MASFEEFTGTTLVHIGRKPAPSLTPFRFWVCRARVCACACVRVHACVCASVLINRRLLAALTRRYTIHSYLA